MKLDTNLKKDKVRMLEDEIFELKQQLEIAQAGTLKLSKSKHSSDLFGVIDGDFNLLSVNAQYPNIFKQNQDNLQGKKCYSAFCGLNQPCEDCSITKNNTNKSVWYFLQPKINTNGAPCKGEVINSINDFAPFELTLRETDLFYEQLFESTGDTLLIVDCKGRILKFTRKLCEMLSYTEEEFSRLTIFDIDDPTHSLPFDERVNQIKRDKGAVFETDLISKSGKLIPVESSSSPIRYGSKTVFFVTFRNIEERINAQRELFESEIRFRSLVENANDLVMRFDRDHRHVFVNSASQQVLGIAPQDFIGKTHQEMGFPEDLCLLWEEEMDKVFDSGIADIIDFSIHAKGNEIFFEWQLIPEFDTEDEIPYLLAVARDVSTRTLSEKALEEALKTKDKFFSIIAHDLRNPFGSLRTLSEYLLNNEDLTKEEIQEFAEIIHTSACQGYDLLENLLEWSRSQRGNIKWDPQEFDLSGLIDSNIKLIQANVHKKQIQLNFKTDKSHYVFADKYMIDTIIRNLLANAVKFTYMNGNIDILLSEREENYCVSIKDDGKGISKEHQTTIFDLDNQHSSVGTSMETGTGLGLILCKEFINTNNGELWVESEVGKGSCFSFTVPKK